MMPVTEYAARCRGEIRLAQQHVGNWTWGVLIDICVEGMTPESAGKRRSGYADAKLARVVALDRLRDGLQRLAELWATYRMRRVTAAFVHLGEIVADPARR